MELAYYHKNERVTKSYALMGANDILESVLTYLKDQAVELAMTSSSPIILPIANPCFPRDYEETWKEMLFRGTGDVGMMIMKMSLIMSLIMIIVNDDDG